ncbi:hypothetical protein PSTT_01457 [Puccinia striiformis]|uniref:Uncharacterized protein n=1 Tax=Puccinia striiformis TaxID=27350 RepID=A0A2S4W3D2_9BASI|nr:hypothetical protein PSTT_01457 [Puccinia striiformis]
MIIPKHNRAPQPQADRTRAPPPPYTIASYRRHGSASGNASDITLHQSTTPLTSIITKPNSGTSFSSISGKRGSWPVCLNCTTHRTPQPITRGPLQTVFITVQHKLACNAVAFIFGTRGNGKSDEFPVAPKRLLAPQWSPHHYNELFANGAHTTFGVGNQSKSTSFDTFADWMNELNPDLKLTGRGLSLRLTSYKRAYTKAKDYEHLTHEGGNEGHGKEILEQICPCFERLDRIFNNQADMTPIMPGDQALRPNPIITGTNGLAGHTVLTLAMVFFGLAFIIIWSPHISLSL